MAVRVRKLAQRLQRSPDELLGVLRAIGYRRYGSAEDMLPSDAEQKLRQAIARGVQPAGGGTDSAVPTPEADPGSDIERLADGEFDVMDAIMRGVTPGRRSARASAAPRPADPVAPVSDASLTARERVVADREALVASRERTLDNERARIDAERADVEAGLRRIDALRTAIEQERAELDQRRRSLDDLAAALSAEREALSARTSVAAPRTDEELVTLLGERGLRGADEFRRALVALAQSRRFHDVVVTLRTDDPDGWRALLGKHLLLAGPNPPDALQRGADAWISVAPDRAEVPDADALKRLGARLSDELLLAGLRRIRLVGGRPSLVRMLQDALDDRVSLVWVAGGGRSVAAARDDVADADVVVLWDEPEDPQARALYDAARPLVVRATGASLGGLVQAMVQAVSRGG